MKLGNSISKEIPLKIVGSTVFGRYPKISVEETFNMIISDNFMVDFAGWANVQTINPNGEGRGIYSSFKGGFLLAVIDDDVYTFDSSLIRTKVGTLDTFTGNVFIAENNANQIALSDGLNIYIYNYFANTFQKAIIDFTPGYLTFQDQRFISPNTASNEWCLSDLNNGLSWPNDAQHRGSIQTKPDKAIATIRFPGRGNLLLVFGKTVSEPWYDIGAQLFPYQRSSTSNIDYGCLNPATIATTDTLVAWLGINEKSGVVIMYTDGGEIKRISNDGIDFKLAQLAHPEDSYGFFFKQDGHILYVIVFPSDNLSYVYDFNTQQFFTLTDPFMNCFIAKRVAFFNNTYYFVSIIDGNLYELSTKFTNAYYGLDAENNPIYENIPRIRICPPFRIADQTRFIASYIGFTIEQGASPPYQYIPPNYQGNSPYPSLLQRVDMTLSKDGGASFGNYQSVTMKPYGNRPNRLLWWRLGTANDLTPQFRFYGFGRFVATDGVIGVYQ